MNAFLKQNRIILIVAVSIFTVSLTSLMLFLNMSDHKSNELSTNVLSGSESHSLNSKEQTLKVQNAVVEKEYRDQVQNQADPFVVVGLDGSVKFTSWNFEEQTGLNPDNIAEKPFFNNLNPDDMPTYFAAFGKVIESGKPMTMVGPYHLRESDGTYKLHMGTIYPIMEKGKVVKLCLISRNISNQVSKSGENTGKKANQLSDAAAVETAAENTKEVLEKAPKKTVETTSEKAVNVNKSAETVVETTSEKAVNVNKSIETIIEKVSNTEKTEKAATPIVEPPKPDNDDNGNHYGEIRNDTSSSIEAVKSLNPPSQGATPAPVTPVTPKKEQDPQNEPKNTKKHEWISGIPG